MTAPDPIRDRAVEAAAERLWYMSNPGMPIRPCDAWDECTKEAAAMYDSLAPILLAVEDAQLAAAECTEGAPGLPGDHHNGCPCRKTGPHRVHCCSHVTEWWGQPDASMSLDQALAEVTRLNGVLNAIAKLASQVNDTRLTASTRAEAALAIQADALRAVRHSGGEPS